MMQRNEIVLSLIAEREKLDRAIQVLDSPETNRLHAPKRGRRRMTSEAKRRISEAQKLRWAKARAESAYKGRQRKAA